MTRPTWTTKLLLASLVALIQLLYVPGWQGRACPAMGGDDVALPCCVAPNETEPAIGGGDCCAAEETPLPEPDESPCTCVAKSAPTPSLPPTSGADAPSLDGASLEHTPHLRSVRDARIRAVRIDPVARAGPQRQARLCVFLL